ncbi:Ltp family lipoprotein [Vagococcus salmoninarum]|uniref:Ltp family lipoprotein n=1 Tax=Vagococcus salmoninarum TaxID=2739 RepID=UPI001D15B6FB|nr:Ltp family lipoprotein [Vagococcus salmoninarum]
MVRRNYRYNRRSRYRKPLLQQRWFWLMVITVIGKFFIADNNNQTIAPESIPPVITSSSTTDLLTGDTLTTAPLTVNQSENISDNIEAEPEDIIPQEYISALNKANSYSKSMHMSKRRIYDQLSSEHGEKFSEEAAQYAVDYLEADWFANAIAKAKSYQSSMSMSPEAIRDQLTSDFGEKFTQEEADYAIENLNP